MLDDFKMKSHTLKQLTEMGETVHSFPDNKSKRTKRPAPPRKAIWILYDAGPDYEVREMIANQYQTYSFMDSDHYQSMQDYGVDLPADYMFDPIMWLTVDRPNSQDIAEKDEEIKRLHARLIELGEPDQLDE